ncbi:MAG: AAA family ATPase, partial [Thiotrichales bacterium]|nr:AAA family ATPase [Thiotrichales bacterium]
MKITDISIDGFGVWNDLRLEHLSPQLTVFYGANEAGKTTLMQFVRAVLYGMSPERRSRYLPPVSGGNPGGALAILDDGEPLRINRIADRGPDDVGLVRITTKDGQATGDRLLREALADVDEPTFNNVFAIGLSEIQQLGTLSDTQAAAWLYRLASGLDRVSLYDVIQDIRQTRSNLLSPPDPSENGKESKMLHLMNRRDLLHGEIRQIVQRNRDWAQLEVRIQELDDQISEQQAQVRTCEVQARTIEIAAGIKPNWRKRAKISSQL